MAPEKPKLNKDFHSFGSKFGNIWIRKKSEILPVVILPYAPLNFGINFEGK